MAPHNVEETRATSDGPRWATPGGELSNVLILHDPAKGTLTYPIQVGPNALLIGGRRFERVGQMSGCRKTACGCAAGSVSQALRKLAAEGPVRRLPREGHRVPYELVRQRLLLARERG
jgi:hypothetical protein